LLLRRAAPLWGGTRDSTASDGGSYKICDSRTIQLVGKLHSTESSDRLVSRNIIQQCFFFLAIATANLPGETADLTTIAEKTRPSVFLITTADRNGSALAAGTGFLVSKDGYLVTNHHVIRKAASAVAKADNGATFRVEGILATDRQRDLAVLKIASRDTPSLGLGASASVKAGEKVAVIGSPLGLEGSLSEGIVAANREIKEFGRMLQITAPISHGSSGSPVLDFNGKVVGVAASSRNEGQAVNFAIPVEELTKLISKIRFGQAPMAFTDPSIVPKDRPDEIAASPAAAGGKTPGPLPTNLLGQIQLKLVSNEKGTLKFEVHNGTGWMLRSISLSMHRWSQHGPGTLNHAKTDIDLKPVNEPATKPYRSAVFTAEVGDFLNDIKTDYGRGPVSDPTYFQTTVVQAIGTAP
jgi:S1-C subfamily serine protease